MATIKVFSTAGVKELKCFDTLENVPILDPETFFEADPFDAIAEMESDRPDEERLKRTRENFHTQFPDY